MLKQLPSRIIASIRSRGCRETAARIASRVYRPLGLYFDGRFDRLYGTDTSGYVPLESLQVKRDSTADCVWYQPVAEGTCRRALDHLHLDLSPFTFVDFGSGKGRAILIASDYPFKEVIGVEFAPTLHRIAEENIRIYTQRPGGCRSVRSVCMDAAAFDIPTGPVVSWMFSPFKRDIMETVLRKIETAMQANRERAVIVFHGQFADTIRRLDALGWRKEELGVQRNLLDLMQYRLVYYSNCGPVLR